MNPATAALRCGQGFARWLATLLAVATIALATATTSVAVQPDEILADPKLEARARAISLELRCLVCQNQSIDDSDAPLARDLRLLVRERLTAGDSDAEVKRFVVARYGEFALLRPPFAFHTLLLWLAPPAFLLATLLALFLKVRRDRLITSETVSAPLTEAEETRLRDALAGAPDPR